MENYEFIGYNYFGLDRGDLTYSAALGKREKNSDIKRYLKICKYIINIYYCGGSHFNFFSLVI